MLFRYPTIVIKILFCANLRNLIFGPYVVPMWRFFSDAYSLLLKKRNSVRNNLSLVKGCVIFKLIAESCSFLPYSTISNQGSRPPKAEDMEQAVHGLGSSRGSGSPPHLSSSSDGETHALLSFGHDGSLHLRLPNATCKEYISHYTSRDI